MSDAKLCPLPWRLDQLVTQEGQANDMLAANGKLLTTTWGSDVSARMHQTWLDDDERLLHAKYIVHVCNHFPEMQRVMADIYDHPGMPESARKIINDTLTRCYLPELPK